MTAFLWALLTAGIWGLVPLMEKVGLSASAPTVGVVVRSFGVVLGLVCFGWMLAPWSALRTLPWSSLALLAGGGFLASFVGQLAFYHPDHLGSVNLVTDGSGAVAELTEHRPFGQASRHDVSPALAQRPSPPGFTGQRHDASTDLAFYHARYYDPALARFTQPDPFVQDPADPQTLNRYSYVRNNPVNLVDPSGNFFQFVIAIVIAGRFQVPSATGRL